MVGIAGALPRWNSPFQMPCRTGRQWSRRCAARSSLLFPKPPHPLRTFRPFASLGEGRLAAVWCGGSREGAGDVAVWFATRGPLDNNPWSAPRPIVTRDSAAQETFRYVRKLGNALLIPEKGDRLSLLYVSVGVGGWSGSSLNLKQSVDGGRTWSRSRRLGLSPFFNVSELRREQGYRSFFEATLLVRSLQEMLEPAGLCDESFRCRLRFSDS